MVGWPGTKAVKAEMINSELKQVATAANRLRYSALAQPGIGARPGKCGGPINPCLGFRPQ
jgi:hypothetical protein